MRSHFRCITLTCTDCPSTGAAFLKTSESIGPYTKVIPTWISFEMSSVEMDPDEWVKRVGFG